MKYLGYYSISGGQTYNRDGYKYSNLHEAKRSMREITDGTCPQGSIGKWWIEDLDAKVVASGTVNK